MKKGFRTIAPHKMLRIIGSVLLYCIVFAGLLVLVFSEESEIHKAVFGSVEGRFLSEITMEYDGETYYYRENEITNYLIIGLDRENIGQPVGHQNGGQADFLVVLSIDRVNRTITPVMLDRDTMTRIQTYGIFGHPSGSRVMQLCLAQAYSGQDSSGSSNTAAAIEALLQGVKIDHYITLDVEAVSLLNDGIDGVEITLQDDFTMYDPSMVKGATIRLIGQQAEFFVRGRMTVADGTNESRMARQQQYISGFLTQLREKMDADPNTPTRLLNSISGHMQTNTAEETLLRDMDAYEDYEWLPMQTIQGTHTIDPYGFAEFWPDETDIKEMCAEIWFEREEQK